MGGQKFAIIEAPSALGLRPSGVQDAPMFFRRSNLYKKLGFDFNPKEVFSEPYSSVRSDQTHMLNADSIKIYSNSLAFYVKELIKRNEFPIVFGGDSSILLGCLLGVHKAERRVGLFYLGGHQDSYPAHLSSTGEVADMAFRIAIQGDSVILNGGNLVRPEHAVLFGYRDEAECKKEGSLDMRKSGVNYYSLADITNLGADSQAKSAAHRIKKTGIKRHWIHLDVDVLNDNLMPAVDYRQPGGLKFEELGDVLDVMLENAIGMDITSYNPKLDLQGISGRKLSRILTFHLKS